MQLQLFTRRVGLPIRRVFFTKPAILSFRREHPKLSDTMITLLREFVVLCEFSRTIDSCFELKLLGATAHQAALARPERSWFHHSWCQ